MPIELFLKSTLTEVHFYLQAYMKSYDEKKQEVDNNAWLNGVYVLYAIGSCLSSNNKYPEKPISLDEYEKKNMTIEQLRQIEENKIRQYMSGGGTNGR